MTITDTVAHKYNYEFISNNLHGTCYRDQLRFGFSAGQSLARPANGLASFGLSLR
jgi:hypothetical protein